MCVAIDKDKNKVVALLRSSPHQLEDKTEMVMRTTNHGYLCLSDASLRRHSSSLPLS